MKTNKVIHLVILISTILITLVLASSKPVEISNNKEASCRTKFKTCSILSKNIFNRLTCEESLEEKETKILAQQEKLLSPPIGQVLKALNLHKSLSVDYQRKVSSSFSITSLVRSLLEKSTLNEQEAENPLSLDSELLASIKQTDEVIEHFNLLKQELAEDCLELNSGNFTLKYGKNKNLNRAFELSLTQLANKVNKAVLSEKNLAKMQNFISTNVFFNDFTSKTKPKSSLRNLWSSSGNSNPWKYVSYWFNKNYGWCRRLNSHFITNIKLYLWRMNIPDGEEADPNDKCHRFIANKFKKINFWNNRSDDFSEASCRWRNNNISYSDNFSWAFTNKQLRKLRLWNCKEWEFSTVYIGEISLIVLKYDGKYSSICFPKSIWVKNIRNRVRRCLCKDNSDNNYSINFWWRKWFTWKKKLCCPQGLEQFKPFFCGCSNNDASNQCPNNKICSGNECICPAGYYENEDKECIQEKECLNGELVNNECTCPNSELILDPLNDEKCVCDGNLHFNPELVNGECECKAGFFKLNGTCQEIPTCTGNFVLVNNVCVCPVDFTLSGNDCICPSDKVFQNGFCKKCLNGNGLDTNGNCTCPADRLLNQNGDECECNNTLNYYTSNSDPKICVLLDCKKTMSNADFDGVVQLNPLSCICAEPNTTFINDNGVFGGCMCDISNSFYLFENNNNRICVSIPCVNGTVTNLECNCNSGFEKVNNLCIEVCPFGTERTNDGVCRALCLANEIRDTTTLTCKCVENYARIPFGSISFNPADYETCIPCTGVVVEESAGTVNSTIIQKCQCLENQAFLPLNGCTCNADYVLNTNVTPNICDCKLPNRERLDSCNCIDGFKEDSNNVCVDVDCGDGTFNEANDTCTCPQVTHVAGDDINGKHTCLCNNSDRFFRNTSVCKQCDSSAILDINTKQCTCDSNTDLQPTEEAFTNTTVSPSVTYSIKKCACTAPNTQQNGNSCECTGVNFNKFIFSREFNSCKCNDANAVEVTNTNQEPDCECTSKFSFDTNNVCVCTNGPNDYKEIQTDGSCDCINNASADPNNSKKCLCNSGFEFDSVNGNKCRVSCNSDQNYIPTTDECVYPPGFVSSGGQCIPCIDGTSLSGCPESPCMCDAGKKNSNTRPDLCLQCDGGLVIGDNCSCSDSNSTFNSSTGICDCNTGFQATPSFECISCPANIASLILNSTSNDYECKCTNSSRILDSSTNTCVCPSGTVDYQGVCRDCSGAGLAIDTNGSDDVCKCTGVNFDINFNTNTNIFECLCNTSNLLDVNSGICQNQCFLDVNDVIIKNPNCFCPNNTVVSNDNTKCECASVNETLDTTLLSCSCSKKLLFNPDTSGNNVCLNDDECPNNSSIDSNNSSLCVCNNGYAPDFNLNDCSKCDSNLNFVSFEINSVATCQECTDPLVNGECQCPPYYSLMLDLHDDNKLACFCEEFYDVNLSICTPYCNFNASTNKIENIANSCKCPDYTNLISEECQCTIINEIPNLNNVCECPNKKYFNYLDSNSDYCLSVNSCDSPEYINTSTNEYCECAAGYEFDNIESKCVDISSGDQCPNDISPYFTGIVPHTSPVEYTSNGICCYSKYIKAVNATGNVFHPINSITNEVCQYNTINSKCECKFPISKILADNDPNTEFTNIVDYSCTVTSTGCIE